MVDKSDAARTKVHHLKTWPRYFHLSWMGLKPFELRVNDRSFAVGDILILEEWDPDTRGYSGRLIHALVLSIVEGVFGLPDNTCIMGIQILHREVPWASNVSKQDDA